MKEIKTAEELHSILLELGKTFHQICVKHSIPYYMLGGTMLGAVRHKGFIPWDDDMDFGVPRQYFEQLKSILEKELPVYYGTLTVQKSDSLLIDIVKIQDKRTVINELYKENVKEEFGINIDVFPLDYSSNGKNMNSKIIQILISLQCYRFLSIKSRPLFKKIVAIFIKVILFPLNKLCIIKFINRFLIDKADDVSYMANYYGAWGCKEIVKTEVMTPGVLYDFENCQLYGVARPHDYLKSLYNDYLKMPSENNRHIHIENVYWKDGFGRESL